MAIPGFQGIMLPLLHLMDDGEAHATSELRDSLAAEFKLSEEERNELIPSGAHTRLYDAVSWAKLHLARAGLVQSPARAQLRITPAGKALVAEQPLRVDMALLARYPSYREFQGKVKPPAPEPQPQDLTAQDALDLSFRQLRAELAEEVLARIQDMTPAFFEKLVVDLMLKLGYGGGAGAGRRLGRSGDGGVDGVIGEDKLGLDVIYLQAKRYGPVAVGRPAVQAFVGSLEGQHARKGVFITTSTFTADARRYVAGIEKRVVLVDGAELAQLMIEVGLGVVLQANYPVCRIDSDYFEEE